MSERVPQSKTRLVRALFIAVLAMPYLLPAKSAPDSAADSANSDLRFISPLTLVGGMTDDRTRLDQLRGQADLDGYLIRSASSMNPRKKSPARWSATFIPPELYAVNNSAIPFSINDGPVWAGVGTSSRVLVGADLAAGPFRLILAPEIVRSENAYFLLRDTIQFYAPPV